MIQIDNEYSNLEKIYMIRDIRNDKHVGFKLYHKKAYPYKNYGSALGYIKKYASNPENYVIDVFLCIHKDLPENGNYIYK